MAETAKALIEKLDRCLLFLNQLLLEMRRNVGGGEDYQIEK